MESVKMEKAERISKVVEACAAELLDKLCEGEPEQVRLAAWSMFLTRAAFADGKGAYFVLPPLVEC